jgi:hypothetical protein
MATPTDIVPTARFMDRLAAEAVAMGADGVIGIRMSQLTNRLRPPRARAHL